MLHTRSSVQEELRSSLQRTIDTLEGAIDTLPTEQQRVEALTAFANNLHTLPAEQRRALRPQSLDRNFPRDEMTQLERAFASLSLEARTPVIEAWSRNMPHLPDDQQHVQYLFILRAAYAGFNSVLSR